MGRNILLTLCQRIFLKMHRPNFYAFIHRIIHQWLVTLESLSWLKRWSQINKQFPLTQRHSQTMFVKINRSLHTSSELPGIYVEFHIDKADVKHTQSSRLLVVHLKAKRHSPWPIHILCLISLLIFLSRSCPEIQKYDYCYVGHWITKYQHLSILGQQR